MAVIRCYKSHRFSNLILTLVIGLGLWLPISHAQESRPFMIESIEIEGLNRLSRGVILNALPTKTGNALGTKESQTILRSLYQTGLFSDVKLAREGNKLIVVVTERPVIGQVRFVGLKSLDEKEITENLKRVDFTEGRVFNKALLERVKQEMLKLYYQRSRYATEIKTEVSPLERNRVAITLHVTEGPMAKIRTIKIVGNQHFPDSELQRELSLAPSRFWAFLSSRDQYAKEKLAGDLENLRSFYMDQGYAQFKIENANVAISEDQKDIYITIRVQEGHQYTLGTIQFAGQTIYSAEKLTSLLKISQGEVFSRKRIKESIEEIGKTLGNQGYAFANIITEPVFNEQTHQVDLTLRVIPGNQIYVRRIEIRGNDKTKDEVIRRELRQMENAWFINESIEKSKTRLNRLGYFEEVKVDVKPIPNEANQVDLELIVKEKPSNNLLAMLGYSQTQGVLFSVKVEQENFLGSGKRIGFVFNNSEVNTAYSVSYFDPYYTVDGVSRGFDLYYRETNAADANLARYSTDVRGGSVTFGFPFSEYDNLAFSLGYRDIKVHTSTLTSREILDYLNQKGDQFNSFALTSHWTRDTRNRALMPDRGSLHYAKLEVAVPGGDLQYYKMETRSQRFFPVTEKLTLSWNGELGYGHGYGNQSGPLPFFEHFYAGGIRSVRGFKDNTLGPRDSTNEPFGGDFSVVTNTELIFPSPFTGIDSKTLRLSAFWDIGNVFSEIDEASLSELRSSMGLGIMWVSPLGPLTFSVAYPLSSKSHDDTQPFQFTIGASL